MTQHQNHLGYSSNDRGKKDTSNRRNGYTRKMLKTSVGEVPIDVPRDREAVYAEVEASIRKLQASLAKRGEKIIADLKAQVAEARINEEGDTSDNEDSSESDKEDAVRHFKSTMEDLTKSLDDTLASLKPDPSPDV